MIVFQITAGSGIPIGADNLGDHFVQHVKFMVGPEDTANYPSTGSGAPDAGTLRMAPAAQEAHLGEVGGNLTTVGVEMIRPANTTAYAAGDAMSDSTIAPTLLHFANLFRVSGGNGYITKVKVLTDKKDCTTKLRLHLFNLGTVTPLNDNAVQTLLYANKASWLGSIDLAALSTEDTSSTAAAVVNDTIRRAVKGNASADLWGMLETIDGFTPASGEKFYIELTCDNN